MTDRQTERLKVYSLMDGSLVGSISSADSGKGQFKYGIGLICITPGDDSVLVADYCNHCVHEVGIAGSKWIRSIGEGLLSHPFNVVCNTDVIVVTERELGRVNLFSQRNGSIRFRWTSDGTGSVLRNLNGMCLTGDGSRIVLAASSCQGVFKLHGELVRTLDTAEMAAHDIIECKGGFITADYWDDTLTMISRAGEQVSVTDDNRFCGPCALAALPDGGLVVREIDSFQVFFGLDLRMAWLQTCSVWAM